jgi:polar amino acid transport system substrate-binding protein
MAEIRDRGRLIVGTSIDTLLFASVDPQTNQIVGFDVDMARLVASAIFGIPADSEALNARIELRGITYGDRIPLVASGEVDLIAHTMTINCRRWQQGVAFSAVYLNAGQKLLVAKDSPATTMDDLRGQVVCASAGGTSADELEAAGAQVAAVGNQTDCLVKLQRGEVAAIRSDDTVLAGFAAQDPNTKVVGEFLTEEPYGLATDADHPEFTQFVNAVLAAAKADGRWQASYDRWLAPALGAPVADLTTGERGIPQPNYSRPLPN